MPYNPANARRFNAPAPAPVQELLKNRLREGQQARDFWTLWDDSASFAADMEPVKLTHVGAWIGGVTAQQAKDMARNGDASAIAASQEIMDKIEAEVPSTGRQWDADVVGSRLVAGKLLAGDPRCMRRRRRVADESQPLTVVFDATSSGGISADDVRKRGIAVLALVQLLAARRPVTLWVGGGLNKGDRNGGWAFFKIDTAPLDLLRAAHLVTHASVTRGLLYSYLQEADGCGGGWPYNTVNASTREFHSIAAQAFPGSEVLALPAIHVADESVRDPIGWVRRELARYTGGEIELAA